MQNLSFILLVSLRLYFCQIISTCELFSDNPLACIEKTSGYSCIYNYFESKCIVEKKTSQGCLDTLNQNACINQLTNEYGEEAQCNQEFQVKAPSRSSANQCRSHYFKLKVAQHPIINMRAQMLQMQIASGKIVSVSLWKKQQRPLTHVKNLIKILLHMQHALSYKIYYVQQVRIIKGMSSGFKGEYGCITVQEEQLETLQCTQHGLTKKACVSIQTEGEECIFIDQMCQSMVQSEINSCLMDLNRQACLAIKNPYISCKWIDNSCYAYRQSNQSNIDELREVNISVCQSIKGLYRYDRENARCIEIDDFKDISCNTLGLSKEGCLKVRNKSCIFYQGTCQELSEQDLKTYSCNMDLNEMACINLETEFQFCKWNGFQCARLFMNQDFDCPLQFEDQSIKVNGNVCQAISKPNVLCKYDQKTNLCVNSTPDDDCDTPFINQKGCISINNVKNKKTCKWINYQCISVQVIPYFTTCESLQYANPQACSQVFENNSRGCYYNQIQQKCVTLQIKLQNDSQKEQQKLDLQLLNSISCENTSLGLNRVACGSITTNGVACMWKQDKCVFIDKKAMISAVPCFSLQWANARACNYVEFQKEICRYDVDELSCVTTAKDHMKCEEIGLNRYACMIAEGFCYFNEDLSLCLNDPSSNISEQLSCDKNSPSKPMCLSITKKGEYCIWQTSSGKCAKASIPFNSNCLTLGYQMNANTCTLIEMSFPDYNIDASKDKSLTLNYGYCKYNYNLNTCQIKNDNCKTKCCTDAEDIGINAHSCSRYSFQDPGVFCYFDEGRCKELTSDIANVLDPEAVKSYYNFKQFKCSQMNINSCSMIEWSTTQRCVHLGNSCFNINLKEQSSLKDLIQEPTITNKYTCFAIEAESLVDKYFTFDEVNRRCKILIPESETPYAKCEDALGNRNLCLRFTGNNYCKWNSDQLKCETIMNYSVDKIEACDANLNIKACIQNKVSPCYFSFASDKCQQAPKEVECNYFNDKGKVSEKVCKLISQKGQKCLFKDNLCATFETYENVCHVKDANQIACYNNVNGNCRWDINTLQCYENLTDISTLNCSSNLNKILCLQVVKEPCYWNADDLQCQRFNAISDVEFKKLNSSNLYTKDACSLISGSGYVYGSDKCEVLPDTSNTKDCSEYWMNEYACLYLTKGHKCYYDVTEEYQRKKCKPFQGEYNQCSDQNSQILINIEVCMNIPMTCIFEQSSLRCVNVEIGPQEKCSKLADSIKEKKYYNKLACSSIDPKSIENFGIQQCYQNSENAQNCLYEKYCFWDQLYYSCSIFVPVLTFFDKNNWVKKPLKVCLNQNSQPEQFGDGCSYQIRYAGGFKFVGNQQIKLPSECAKTHNTCRSDDDCIPYQTTNIQLDYINGKMKVTFPTNNTQTCGNRCGFQGQQTNFCNQDSDCGQEYITKDNLKYTDMQYCRVLKRRSHYINVYSYYFTTNPPLYSNYTFYSENKIDDVTTITYYKVTEVTKELEYEPIKEEDCDFDDKKCYCQYTKEDCKYHNDCPKQVKDIYAYKKKCDYQDYYLVEPYCISKIREIEKCENIYSEALCLEYVKQRCYFDINQGGCIKLEDNQDKLPQCNSMSMDSCLGSKTKKVACSKGEKSAKPGDSCYTIIKEFNDCKDNLFYNSYFNCAKVKKEDAQHSLCARATDECRFSGSECVSEPNLDDTLACKCDSSYSQTLCEKCNCDFSSLGICQQTKQPLQQDANNPFSLCYRVNLLDLRDAKSKQQACASVAQACKYIDSCQDATHITCDDMLGSMVVSLKACQKCKDQPAQYDLKRLQCLALNDDTLINKCEYLNKISCLRNARNVKCKWDQSQCKEIQIASDDIVDCSTLNYDACYQSQQNLCWFDPQLKQCTEFNPFKAQCEFVQDQQNLCNLSMAQNCVWENNKCTKKDKILPNTCKGLNKYACLNQQLVPCGWSVNQECIELINIINYANFLQSAESKSIIQNNAQTCSLISEYKNYLIDQQFKCREVTVIDLIYCNTPGINLKSCVQLSIGRCKYQNNICQTSNEVNLGCQNYLNKEACLSQKAECKFTDKCEQFLNPNLNEILYEIDYSYSDYICLTVDLQTKPTTSLVFLESKGKCIDISDQEPTISDCQLRGMNINACLQKTKSQCEYLDNQCQSISVASQSTCSQTLNWLACTQSDAQCKFVNARCQAFQPTDNCEQLEQLKAIVNESICVKTTDIPCKYDINIRGCSKVTTNQNCSISGLNEKSCIFYTSGQDCKYEMNQCTPYYQQAKCTDKINRDKCLNLRDRQQNCKFDQTLGCIQIISESDLKSCIKNFQTNPSTCSQATDFPCYYNFDTKMCQVFTNPSKFETPSRSQDWQSRVSFNILTCQIYDIDQRKTFWDDGCKETTNTQLTTLECKDYLNYYACVNLKTPLQYCQYTNNICYEKDWFTYKDQQCEQIKNVNHGNFCQATTDVECRYDLDNKNCIKLGNGEIIQCQSSNLVYFGYNEKACAKSNNCIFIDNKCQTFDENNLYYCQQAQQIENCRNVLLEGCYRNSQQRCQLITSELQKTLNCSDIENQVGCKQLQTKGQYCRYYDNKCQNENIQDYKVKNCKDIKMINNYEFCEQTQDIGCIYDPLNNSCIESKQEQQDLTCPRGLNKLACIPLNSNTNQCQFFNYCYGFNSDILNCINDDHQQCCQKALTIQSCLFQTKFKCQWNNNKCNYYDQQINQKLECNTIQNASRNVCYSLLDKFCIFDHFNFKCIQIIPLTCDSVQSAQQCKRIPNIPCYWNQDQCQLKQQDLSDTCQFISQNSGNHQACIQIKRPGQMCIFNDYQCLLFQEIQNTDNCLDNINQNACLQQTNSQCYWDLDVANDQNSPHKYCKSFEKFNSSKCEQNLSYLSCLNIVTTNTYCQWINEKCEPLKIDISNKLVLESYSNVNANVCRLITDPQPMMYDSINKMCQVVTDFNQLTCSQGLMSINMYACIKVKNELCVWDNKIKACKAIVNQKKKIANQEEIAESTCQKIGRTPTSCSLLDVQLPCGGAELGCDYVQLKTVQCNHIGLNKYACLNLTSQSCKWVLNKELNIYQCQEHTPFGLCSEQPKLVNAMLCSLVGHKDPCAYDKSSNSCKWSSEQQQGCDTAGLNKFGCAQIKNCVFYEGRCLKYSDDLDLNCQDADKAHYTVCAQITRDQCKYSELKNGCVSTDLFDSCQVMGINQLGCNAKQPICQWIDKKCECTRLFELKRPCSQIQDFDQCQTRDECYYNDSFPTRISNELIKSQNQGTCKEKSCSDREECEGEIVYGYICYKDKQGICQPARDCQDIKNAVKSCSSYVIKDRPCVEKGYSNDNIQCETLLNCQQLDLIACQKNLEYCIYGNDQCTNKQCNNYMDETSCPKENCYWKNSKKRCLEQVSCELNSSEKECSDNGYANQKCGWFKLDDQPSFCQAGCRYLPQAFVSCRGTQITDYVCVNFKDVCIQCEEITDSCHCLQEEDFCHYDIYRNKCQSKGCQTYNSETCPASRCTFNKEINICIPQCQFRFNIKECGYLNDCVWDQQLRQCLVYEEKPINVEICPGCLKAENYLAIILLIISLSAII
ncbi:unnamed protein product (macronuclear) [Paramecium tetraurelia]|uniref:Transmembrane protein n=1 Tax=Paramecium tetraurelia TaxID=5888 RepID=A0C4L9_PARTE|nr:uncharacterized protein GSPATT00006235001 [Paramecium tetraurelia]CAK65736.1 unnamed protein product [Paramecium tetraurelia]|eukprot:XP_001433133.1 hypothetical protein (macronuclear) [Paramecium tetraurelia strain d4-2]